MGGFVSSLDFRFQKMCDIPGAKTKKSIMDVYTTIGWRFIWLHTAQNDLLRNAQSQRAKTRVWELGLWRFVSSILHLRHSWGKIVCAWQPAGACVWSGPERQHEIGWQHM